MTDLDPSCFSDPASARRFLEGCRWPNGVFCPRCRTKKSYPLHPDPGSTTRPGLYKCAACRRQFSVVTGTFLERTHLPFHVWLQAIDRLCATPAGLTPQELRTALTVSYKTASAMADRLQTVAVRWPVTLKVRPNPVRTNRERTVVRLHPMQFSDAVTRLLRVAYGSCADRLRQLDEQGRL